MTKRKYKGRQSKPISHHTSGKQPSTRTNSGATHSANGSNQHYAANMPYKSSATPATTAHPIASHSAFRWREHWWQAALLLTLPFIMYWQAVSFGYVLDDQIVITDNSYTKQGWAGIDDLLLTESFTGYFGEQKNLVQGSRYRPLSLITFAVEYALTDGLTPWLSHLINIMLYGLVALLIYKVLVMVWPSNDKLWPGLSLPLCIALLYLAHPLHTEAVANIKGRDEILAMVLSLASLYYIWQSQILGRSRALVYGCLSFFLALLAKENSITFLAIIPVTLYYFGGSRWWRACRGMLPLVGVTAAYIALRIYAAGIPSIGEPITDLMNNPFLGMTMGEKSATISYTLLRYLQLYSWPHPLSHDYYPYAIPKLGWLSWQAITALLVHIALVWYALKGIRSRTASSYGIWFYILAISIVSNVVVNLGTFMNERFVFMASLGLTITTTTFIYRHVGTWRGSTGQLAATVLLAAIFILHTSMTIDRVPDWQSALTLNRSAVEGGSQSARANSFMATALYNEVKSMPPSPAKEETLSQAYDYATKAVTIHPRYSNANLMLAGISAELYKQHRDQDRLLVDFAQVARRRPDVGYLSDYLDYLEGNTNDIDGLRQWYADTGLYILTDTTLDNSWAAHYLLRAFKIDSKDTDVLAGLVQAYSSLGDQANAQRFANRLNTTTR